MKSLREFLWRTLWLAILLLIVLGFFWALFPTAPLFLGFYEWRINRYLGDMTPEVRASINSITVVPAIDSEGIYAGRCDHQRNIFLTARAVVLQPSAIWHEATHAYNFQLNHSGSDFYYRWQQVRGGIITSYGATHPMEDVAEWVEEIHQELNGLWSEFDFLGFSEENITPYRSKLELLREYGFISEEDYQRFIRKNPIFRKKAALLPRAVFVIISQ